MCGIFGFTKYTASPQQLVMVSVLADKMVERGRQSWGSTDGITVKKFAETIALGNWSLGHFMEPSQGHLQTMLAHTRASSHGAITVENAHPHVAFSEDAMHMIVGVHNGTIVDDSMVAHNTKKFEVDSQMIFDMLVNDLPTKDLEGTGVLVYMQDQNSLRMLRFNSTNLYVARDLGTGGLIWASTQAAVLQAALRAGITLSDELKVEPCTIYEVQDSPQGHTLVEVGKQEFAAPKAIVHVHNGADWFGNQVQRQRYNGVGSGYHGGTYEALCLGCKSLRKTVQGFGFCTVCTKIALAPKASSWENSVMYMNHYLGTELTSEPTPPIVPAGQTKTDAVIQGALATYCPSFGHLIGED
jgi:hypothetical protein